MLPLPRQNRAHSRNAAEACLRPRAISIEVFLCLSSTALLCWPVSLCSGEHTLPRSEGSVKFLVISKYSDNAMFSAKNKCLSTGTL